MTTTIQQIFDELHRADQKYPPMAEAVEGLHTIKCELAELEREIMKQSFDQKAMIKEALQVAAMSLKFLRDCCYMPLKVELEYPPE